jgi:Type II secretion system (T2SS), protein E, N-terminal domain
MEKVLNQEEIDAMFRAALGRDSQGAASLARGVISDPQLREAIALQRVSGERIGACLQRLACISEHDIASVVATQSGCPVFPTASVQPGCSMLVPCSLIERYRMLPVHVVSQGQRLFVGFCDKVNHPALLAIEQMLGCNIEACVIPEPKLLQGIEYRKHDTNGEIAIGRPRSAAETAHMILSYAQQTATGTLRLQEVEGNI